MKDRETIISELKEIITPFTEETTALAEISDETDFIKDLKINSANLVDIILDIEDKFGIEIDNDSMAKMLTVKASIEVIEEKLAAKDAG